jgi:hypothetical protein
MIFNMGALGQYIKGRTSGSYRIATELRSSGWDVEVVDFFYFWTLDELKTLAKDRINTSTKFIGFSHIFSDWPELAEDFTTWLKETYPEIKIIKAGLLFVVSKEFIKEEYTTHHRLAYFEQFKPLVNQLDACMENGVWNPKRNFTCPKHCPVLECMHNGKN